MDLLKLIAELREYGAQVEEAIASMEALERRRRPAGTGEKTPKTSKKRSGPSKMKRRARKKKPK
jgi:hypothetical protein